MLRAAVASPRTGHHRGSGGPGVHWLRRPEHDTASAEAGPARRWRPCTDAISQVRGHTAKCKSDPISPEIILDPFLTLNLLDVRQAAERVGAEGWIRPPGLARSAQVLPADARRPGDRCREAGRGEPQPWGIRV